MSKDSESDAYEIISHPGRRLLVKALHERPGRSFTELMQISGESTGSLSFHLNRMEPLLAHDEEKRYSLNSTGERVYSAMRELATLSTDERGERTVSEVTLARDEKLILTSNMVRALGQDHAVGGLTKTLLHHVNATLTSRKLVVSGWRLFRPQEIRLTDVKLVRVRTDIPLTSGDVKGRSIEVTYGDAAGRLHRMRFAPPEVQKWATAIREACSEAMRAKDEVSTRPTS